MIIKAPSSPFERRAVEEPHPDKRGSWHYTYTGKRFWPLAPKPSDICIEDIAHALSNVCRFTGHTKTHLSVAQHSINVMRVLKHRGYTDRDTLLAGLLHDASEAYIADVSSPLKAQPEFAAYRNAEIFLETVIKEAFDIDESKVDRVGIKNADETMFWAEAKEFMPGMVFPGAAPDLFGCVPIHSRSNKEAEQQFLSEYQELSGMSK